MGGAGSGNKPVYEKFVANDLATRAAIVEW
jgi:hypothetical protein